MPRLRHRRGRRLTAIQESFLGAGDLFCETLVETFGTMDKAREAWQRERLRLQEKYFMPCRRLWGWWAFEAPSWRHLEPHLAPAGVDLKPGDYRPRHEDTVLESLGILDQYEQRELQRWRAALDEPDHDEPEPEPTPIPESLQDILE